jgi:aspartyl-tRNA(Asn)/glutamyl-tRNA(Gln) amidotransferase subunit B
MPGVLPVINSRAVEFTIMTGLALNCEIPPRAKFDRKNYPYPDLMKGYQISQYDMPLCRNGHVDVEVDGVKRRIRVNRVHLEEDTARLLHRADGSGDEYSLVDINRAGMPLMEIVTEPDARSAAEAVAYLQKLRQILRYLGVSHANMEEGNFRCEPNLSLRPRGSSEFGQKVELKNLNSFRAALRAMEFEVRRQGEVLRSGGRVVQETRGWREDTQETASQRSKEEAHDYRYFPEPDLPPLSITPEQVEEIRRRLPELPESRRERFFADYGLTPYEADLLSESRSRADFYEAAVEAAGGGSSRAKLVSNWFLTDFTRHLNAAGIEPSASRVSPVQLAALVVMVDEGKLNGAAAKQVLEVMFAEGGDPERIVSERGLAVMQDEGAVLEVVRRVIAENPKVVSDYKSGKPGAINALVGPVMRETRGRANAKRVQELLETELNG